MVIIENLPFYALEKADNYHSMNNIGTNITLVHDPSKNMEIVFNENGDLAIQPNDMLITGNLAHNNYRINKYKDIFHNIFMRLIQDVQETQNKYISIVNIGARDRKTYKTIFLILHNSEIVNSNNFNYILDDTFFGNMKYSLVQGKSNDYLSHGYYGYSMYHIDLYTNKQYQNYLNNILTIFSKSKNITDYEKKVKYILDSHINKSGD